MKKWLVVLMFLLATVVINVPQSSGYPWIFKQFRDRYLPADAPEEFKEEVRTAGCYVCHDPNHPKDEEGWEEFHNPYGEALEDILGDPEALEERFKDRAQRQDVLDEIDQALEDVDGEPSGDDEGRTFGQRMNMGLLPYELPEGFGGDTQ